MDMYNDIALHARALAARFNRDNPPLRYPVAPLPFVAAICEPWEERQDRFKETREAKAKATKP